MRGLGVSTTWQSPALALFHSLLVRSGAVQAACPPPPPLFPLDTIPVSLGGMRRYIATANLDVIVESSWSAKTRAENFMVIEVLCFSTMYISSIAGDAKTSGCFNIYIIISNLLVRILFVMVGVVINCFRYFSMKIYIHFFRALTLSHTYVTTKNYQYGNLLLTLYFKRKLIEFFQIILNK